VPIASYNFDIALAIERPQRRQGFGYFHNDFAEWSGVRLTILVRVGFVNRRVLVSEARPSGRASIR
jgi:hypothetical protein